MIEKRLDPRSIDVPFHFLNNDSHSVVLIAEDASVRGARFSGHYKSMITDASRGYFELHKEYYSFDGIKMFDPAKRMGACVIEYEASSNKLKMYYLIFRDWVKGRFDLLASGVRSCYE
jgi:hypothetical protein